MKRYTWLIFLIAILALLVGLVLTFVGIFDRPPAWINSPRPMPVEPMPALVDPDLPVLSPAKDKPISGGLLRQCPSYWYENRMPQIIEPGEMEKPYETYLTIDGKNYSPEEVDVEWVRLNCEVTEPEIVW